MAHKKSSKAHGERLFLIWLVMMRYSTTYGTFTRTEVMLDADDSRDYVHRYLKGLIKAGYAERLPDQPVRGAKYRVIKPQHATPRLRADGTDLGETIHATLWRTMRMLKSFDAAELAHHASLPERPVKLVTASAYACRLQKSGLLSVLSPGRRLGANRHLRRYMIIGVPGSDTPRTLKARRQADGPAH